MLYSSTLNAAEQYTMILYNSTLNAVQEYINR